MRVAVDAAAVSHFTSRDPSDISRPSYLADWTAGRVCRRRRRFIYFRDGGRLPICQLDDAFPITDVIYDVQYTYTDSDSV